MSLGPDSRGTQRERSSGAGSAPGRALVPVVSPAPTSWRGWRLEHALWATGLVLALGLGGFGLDIARSSHLWSARADAAKQQADTTGQMLHRLGDEVAHLKGSVDTLRTASDAKQDDSLRGLKKSVDALKQEIEQVRSNDSTVLAQLSTKIDKTDHDPSQKLADIMARLDKLDRDPKAGDGQRLAEVASRLDRLERQVSATTPTGSIPPSKSGAPALTAVPLRVPAPAGQAKPAPRQEASLAPPPAAPAKLAAKPDTSVVPIADAKVLAAKPPTVDGWVVRDVYDGLALVEARRGDLREIAPGEFLPGAGEIRSIERRGKSWVVLTSRGVIENSTF